jgi:LPXTG-motif cell wall-anchored protein
MGNMHGYGQGGWMVLLWIGGIAILILLVWLLWRRRSGK